VASFRIGPCCFNTCRSLSTRGWCPLAFSPRRRLIRPPSLMPPDEVCYVSSLMPPDEVRYVSSLMPSRRGSLRLVAYAIPTRFATSRRLCHPDEVRYV